MTANKQFWFHCVHVWVPRYKTFLKHRNTYQRNTYQRMALSTRKFSLPLLSPIYFTCDTHSPWLCLFSPSLLATILQMLLREFHELAIQISDHFSQNSLPSAHKLIIAHDHTLSLPFKTSQLLKQTWCCKFMCPFLEPPIQSTAIEKVSIKTISWGVLIFDEPHTLVRFTCFERALLKSSHKLIFLLL